MPKPTTNTIGGSPRTFAPELGAHALILANGIEGQCTAICHRLYGRTQFCICYAGRDGKVTDAYFDAAELAAPKAKKPARKLKPATA